MPFKMSLIPNSKITACGLSANTFSIRFSASAVVSPGTAALITETLSNPSFNKRCCKTGTNPVFSGKRYPLDKLSPKTTK